MPRERTLKGCGYLVKIPEHQNIFAGQLLNRYNNNYYPIFSDILEKTKVTTKKGLLFA